VFKSARAIAHALRAGEPTDDPTVQTFYKFATASPTNDVLALAACMEGMQREASPQRLAGINTPILIVVGDRDDLAGTAPELIELIPTARLVTIPGRDHLGTVPAREFKRAAVDFLTAE
jgi:pimeloyl-ACP methyl ester carboxylesterase